MLLVRAVCCYVHFLCQSMKCVAVSTGAALMRVCTSSSESTVKRPIAGPPKKRAPADKKRSGITNVFVIVCVLLTVWLVSAQLRQLVRLTKQHPNRVEYQVSSQASQRCALHQVTAACDEYVCILQVLHLQKCVLWGQRVVTANYSGWI